MSHKKEKAPLHFVKMQGCGNHFVVASVPRELITLFDEAFARKICAKHFGIGADGIMIVSDATKSWADFDVLMWNPDGSLMGMCGNGIRCVSRFLDRGSLTFNVEGSPIKTSDDGELVSVEMGYASFDPQKIGLNQKEGCIEQLVVLTSGEKFAVTAVSMPNPHGVIFVDTQLAVEEVARIGPELEHHPLFMHRANIEFVKISSRNRMDVLVWERGAGMTLACGTGACAAVAAGIRLGIVDSRCTVQLPGGTVFVESCETDGMMILKGPAVKVFEGVYSYDL